MKKYHITYPIILLFVILSMVGCSSNKDSNGEIKATYTPFKNFEYDTKESNITIKEYNGSKSSVVIPDTIDDSYVTSIDKSVLKDKKITDLTLPSKFKTIKIDTFKDCTNLEKLTYQGSSIENLFGTTKLKEFNAPNLKNLSSISLASLNLETLNIPDYKYVVFNMSKELSFTLTNSNEKKDGTLIQELDSTLKRSLYTAMTKSKAITVNGKKYAHPNKKLVLKDKWEAISGTKATLEFEKNSMVLGITTDKNNSNTNTYHITDLQINRANLAQITTTNPKIKKFGAILVGDYICVNYNNTLILFRHKGK